MKTIKRKGKIYQIDAMYEFSDDGKVWCKDALKDIHQDMSDQICVGLWRSYNFIRACEVKVGTITDAPVELIDGECYQFTDRYDDEHKGFFLAETGRLYCTTGAIVDPSRCTNIKHLTVGENSNEQV